MPESSFAPQQLGPYRIGSMLGRGGSAVVYRAECDGKAFALKVLENPFHDPARVQRFQREAAALAALDHPGLVGIDDWGEIDGYHYMALELLDARPLDEVLEEAQERSATLQADRLRWLLKRFEEVAETLEYLHSNGITHRDVKPDNILVDRDGRARLVDLSIARDNSNYTMTEEGELLGTIYYLSPEQAMAGRSGIDHTTDIYSLGASLYACLTNEYPFDGEHSTAIFKQIMLDDPVSLSEFRPDVSPALKQLVSKCMQKDPRDRYQSAARVAEDLSRIRNLRPVAISGPAIHRAALRWAKRHRAKLGVAVLIIATGVAAYFWNEARWKQYANWAEFEIRLLSSAAGATVTAEWTPNRMNVPEWAPDAPPLRGNHVFCPAFAELVVVLERDGVHRRYTFIPGEAKRTDPIPIGWADGDAEMVRVPGDTPFRVRTTALNLTDVEHALERLEGFPDTAGRYEHLAERAAKNREKGSKHILVSMPMNLTLISTLGYRPISWKELAQIDLAIASGAVDAGSIDALNGRTPVVGLTLVAGGLSDKAIPVSDPRVPTSMTQSSPCVLGVAGSELGNSIEMLQKNLSLCDTGATGLAAGRFLLVLDE